MKLTIEKEHENKLTFSLDDVSPSFANIIRRYAMSRIPIVAIDKLTVYHNTSSIFDEYIAHRIGLIPLKTPGRLSKNAEITFTLDVSGPKTVYSGDLKSSDSQIVVVKDDIPIINLNQDQRLMFEAKAVVGIGRKHAKFQSAIVSYGISKNKFNFLVEGFYQMPVHDILVRACDQIEGDLDEFLKLVKKKPK